jgi:hypothetical protein
MGSFQNLYFRTGHHAGGFRVWWPALAGSDDTLENTHLMRMAGRFSRRIRSYAKAHNIVVTDCSGGDRKRDVAEQYRAKTPGRSRPAGTPARIITSSEKRSLAPAKDRIGKISDSASLAPSVWQ